MEELKKRWRLLAFVAVGLLVAALLSLSPVTWATPRQLDCPRERTIVAKDGLVCAPLAADDVILTFWFRSEICDWTKVVFTDVIDPVLKVKNVIVECDPGPCPADTTWDSGPGVTPVVVTMGDGSNKLPAGTMVTIKIECTCEEHKWIANLGRVEFYDGVGTWELDATWKGAVDPCEEVEVPETGSLLLLGSGLAGLVGYAGMRWRVRRDSTSHM